MAVELGERVGPSLEWWLERPFAYALYAYRHLQEIDRRRDFIARVQRIEQGQLMAMAFHEPSKLAAEYRMAIADAGPVQDSAEVLDLGRRLAADLEALGVLD